MKIKLTFTVLVMSFSLFTMAQETNAPKFGKGIFNLVGQDSTWSMNVGAECNFWYLLFGKMMLLTNQIF